jgi:hypothetical protein
MEDQTRDGRILCSVCRRAEVSRMEEPAFKAPWGALVAEPVTREDVLSCAALFALAGMLILIAYLF